MPRLGLVAFLLLSSACSPAARSEASSPAPVRVGSPAATGSRPAASARAGTAPEPRGLTAVVLEKSGRDRNGGPVYGAKVVGYRDGALRDLFSSSKQRINGHALSADGRWLVLVHVPNVGYGGASVPPYLRGLSLSVVELASGKVHPIKLETGCNAQSISVRLGEGGIVQVRLRHVHNGYDEKRLSLACRIDEPACGGPADAASTDVLTTDLGAYLEVTATTAYRVERVPAELASIPGLDRRSVHRSPTGQWVAYVTAHVDEDGDEKAKQRPAPRFELAMGVHRSALAQWAPVRTLWVRESTSGKTVRVTSGEGTLHSAWADDDTLVFEAEPVVGEDRVKEEVRQIEKEQKVLNPGLKIPPSELEKMARVRLGSDPAAWSAPLLARSMKTQAERAFLGPQARLGGLFDRVRVVDSGVVVEVGPLERPRAEPTTLSCDPLSADD